MAGERLPVWFLLRSQLWFRWTGKCLETATGHMQTVSGKRQNRTEKMIIDTTFDFNTDANGGDPDSTSPTLRSYHKYLWSKPLPNGEMFELSIKSGTYLFHHS